MTASSRETDSDILDSKTAASAPAPEASKAALFAGEDPEPIRFLDDEGNWSPSASAAPYERYLTDVSRETKQQWYLDMLLTRAFDTECTNLQRQGQLALWVPSLGQEGCQVGFAHAAEPQDHLFPSYREHVIAHARGVDLVELGKVFRGLGNSGWDAADPKNGNVHNYTLVLGAQTHHAVGYALGQMLDAKLENGDSTLDAGSRATPAGEATMVFYGDGTTSQGDANESMIFAASYQAPVVFIVQNNQWAISVPVARQSRTPLYRRALGFGLPAVQIDGNDPLAAYAVAKHSMDQARAGHGPHYIEALTYRMGAHTTSDDPTRYRDSAEAERWGQRDPLKRFKQHLQDSGVDEQFFADAEARAAEFARHCREQILALPKPHPDSMFAHVYAESHPRIAEQRQWLARYEASFTEEAA